VRFEGLLRGWALFRKAGGIAAALDVVALAEVEALADDNAVPV
jgi:hypothetical protein